MKILKFIVYIFTHIIQRIFQIVSSILITIIASLIYIVTYEPGTKCKVTPRKVRRIRFLTKVKLYSYKCLTRFYKFKNDSYLKHLYNKFGFLINK